MASEVKPFGQEGRPACSLPMADADLSLGNANWSKGLQSMSDWIWSGNLNPVPFPNNLARYFLHVPAIFEQQLAFSTTLIFDEPSFRNGVQVSGFVHRVTRELVISLIAQRRRCWYSMTHHAVLGYLTAKRFGLTDQDVEAKWSRLTDHAGDVSVYSPVEKVALAFADAFATNPKAYSDQSYESLRAELAKDFVTRYPEEGLWQARLEAARVAEARALAAKLPPEVVAEASRAAAAVVPPTPPDTLVERAVDASVVELAFLCLQFVALTGVFTALNLPDESFLADVMQGLLPTGVVARINELNEQGGAQLTGLVPPPVPIPIEEILRGRVVVASAPAEGARVPLRPYELYLAEDRDKGLTVGGVQVGVYGWSFGGHFPGSLVYALANHPELARFEPPYSLPLLFNEDEWRNGSQTGGFVSRLLKELVFQKIYQTTRSRYGLEHHTMFLYNTCKDLYGVGRRPDPLMTAEQRDAATREALARAEAAVLSVGDHEKATQVFSSLERAVLTWTHRILTAPHTAWEAEKDVRRELEAENRREEHAALRRVDASPGLGDGAAQRRLVDHQIAELAMLIGHMDGLGRVLTILRLESEKAVQIAEGTVDWATGAVKPKLNKKGEFAPTGYFNNRPGLLDILPAIGVSEKVLTFLELLVNPELNAKALHRLRTQPGETIEVTRDDARQTAEF